MDPLPALVYLISNPVGKIDLHYWEHADNSYCLTLKEYVIFPKKVKDSNGNQVTRFLECEGVIIDIFDKETYDLYTTAIESYLKTTEDHIKFRNFRPKPITVKTPKPKFADAIKAVEEARKEHQNKVDELQKKFLSDATQLGVDVWIENMSVTKWPENCQFKDEWYKSHQDLDYSKCQLNLVFHRETELYRELSDFKSAEAARRLDLSRKLNEAGPFNFKEQLNLIRRKPRSVLK